MIPLSDQAKSAFSAHRAGAAPPGGSSGPPERLREFADAFFEGVGPVLTTMTNRPVHVAVLGIEELTPTELLRRVPLPWLLVDVRYARGLTGGHRLVLSRPSALVLGDALTGEDGTEVLEILPSHAEAVRETVNQMLSTAAASLTPVFGRSISFEPVSAHVIDDPATLTPELSGGLQRLHVVRAEATGLDGFRAEFWLTIGAELTQEITTVGVDPQSLSPVDARATVPDTSGLGLILDVTLPVAVELGRARMQIQDILKLAPGSIVELDKSAGDPVEILINDRPIAKGEVVVIDENFGVRLTSIVTATERIKSFR